MLKYDSKSVVVYQSNITMGQSISDGPIHIFPSSQMDFWNIIVGFDSGIYFGIFETKTSSLVTLNETIRMNGNMLSLDVVSRYNGREVLIAWAEQSMNDVSVQCAVVRQDGTLTFEPEVNAKIIHL